MAKPTKFPNWAGDNTGSVGAGVTEPLDAKKEAGWVSPEKPPDSWFNWILNTAGRWVIFFYNEMLSPQHTDAGAHKDVTALSVGVDKDQNADSGVTVENDQGGVSAASALKLTSNSGAYGIFLRWWKNLAGVAPAAILQVNLPSGKNPYLLFTEAPDADDVQTSLVGHDGTTVAAQVAGFRKGEVWLGAYDIAAASLVGHPALPTCDGPPTGTPTVLSTYYAPLIFDRTNAKLYAYMGGAWVGVPLATGGVIQNAGLRDSGALSVVGRAANTSGAVADIAGTDGQVLRVTGTTLGFRKMAYARYSTNTIQSMATGAATIIDFEDMVMEDADRVTAGAAWKFTADRAMILRVSARAQLNAAAWAAASLVSLLLHKNNGASALVTLDQLVIEPAQTNYINVGGTALISLANTDTLDIRLFHNQGAAVNITPDTGGTDIYVDINEVG